MESWIALAGFVASLVGGCLGVYIGYRMVEYRVGELEQRANATDIRLDRHSTDIEHNRRDADDKLGRIAADVSYIRGKMENK